jgi:hypothetical protein
MMKALDWLKFVGAYAGGVALAIAMESIFRGTDPTAPWRTSGVFAIGAVGALPMARHAHGSPAAPLPRRLLASVMGVLAVLNAGLALLVHATAGWKDGLAPALQLAVVGAVLVPTVSQSVIWMLSRKTRRVDTIS